MHTVTPCSHPGQCSVAHVPESDVKHSTAQYAVMLQVNIPSYILLPKQSHHLAMHTKHEHVAASSYSALPCRGKIYIHASVAEA